jgi:hypothetical protein
VKAVWFFVLCGWKRSIQNAGRVIPFAMEAETAAGRSVKEAKRILPGLLKTLFAKTISIFVIG